MLAADSNTAYTRTADWFSYKSLYIQASSSYVRLAQQASLQGSKLVACHTHTHIHITTANQNQFKRSQILMDHHISRRTWNSSLSHAGEAAPAREHCPPRYALPGWRTCLTSPRISGTCPPGLQQGGHSRLEQLQTQTKRAHRVNLLCCK